MSTLLLILDGNCVDIIRAEENEFIPHVLILHKWELDNVTFDKLVENNYLTKKQVKQATEEKITIQDNHAKKD